MEYFHLSEGPRRTLLVVVLLHKLELIADICQETSEMATSEGSLVYHKLYGCRQAPKIQQLRILLRSTLCGRSHQTEHPGSVLEPHILSIVCASAPSWSETGVTNVLD